jgi:hypothetical protein
MLSNKLLPFAITKNLHKKINANARYILNQGRIMKKNSNWQTPYFFAAFNCQNRWSELNLNEHTFVQRGKLQ